MSRRPVKRPLSEKQKAALDKARAARRARRDATGDVARDLPSAEQPAFLNEPPPPEARDSVKPQASDTLRQTVVNEAALTYAGAHYVGAFLTQVEQFQVNEDEARNVAARFVHMMEAWGFSLDTLAGGKILATINFAVVFGTIELSKLALLRIALAERQARAAQGERTQDAGTVERGPAPVADVVMPGPTPTGPEAMHHWPEAAE